MLGVRVPPAPCLPSYGEGGAVGEGWNGPGDVDGEGRRPRAGTPSRSPRGPGRGVRPHRALLAGLEPLQLVQSQPLTTRDLAAAPAVLPSHWGGGSVSLRPSQACC